MAYRIIAALIFLALSGCAHNSMVCRSPYNYLYRVVYDDSGRISQIMASTRADIEFDNCTGIHSIRTAPEAPSGVFRSIFEGISKFIGNVFGSMF